MKPLLSILIPTIPSREEKMNRLYDVLSKQFNYPFYDSTFGDYVQVIIDSSKAFLDGGVTIGAKRNSLKQMAEGKYLCFIDDDDMIPPNYIDNLVRACWMGRDIVTFKSLVKLENSWGVIDMRLSEVHNSQFTPVGVVKRPPWHICPVKTKIAQAHTFQNINNAEDFDWMQRVLMDCKTESHLDVLLYEYNHGQHSEADKIERTKHE